MTIIDTTLYANGALRLSRHGAGRGGNVLMHVASGAECTIADDTMETVVRFLDTCTQVFAEQDFNKVAEQYADPTLSNERSYGGKRHKVIDHLIVPA